MEFNWKTFSSLGHYINFAGITSRGTIVDFFFQDMWSTIFVESRIETQQDEFCFV